ncbi:MAG: hypothetical protein OXI66_12365 [Boseongicola sp.]|nr:hypothetical protein [Boseongicola sp.]
MEKVGVSECAKAEATRSGLPDGPPVHSFRTLLDDLSGKSLIQLRLPGHGTILSNVVTVPTGCRKGLSSPSA